MPRLLLALLLSLLTSCCLLAPSIYADNSAPPSAAKTATPKGADYSVAEPKFHWALIGRPINIYIKFSGIRQNSHARLTQATKNAFTQWQKALPGQLVLNYTTTADNADITIHFTRSYTKPWKDKKYNAQHSAHPWNDTLSHVMATIVLRKEAHWKTVNANLLHQVGHALGANHSPHPQDVMYYDHTFNNTHPNKIHLSPNDVTSIASQYTKTPLLKIPAHPSLAQYRQAHSINIDIDIDTHNYFLGGLHDPIKKAKIFSYIITKPTEVLASDTLNDISTKDLEPINALLKQHPTLLYFSSKKADFYPDTKEKEWASLFISSSSATGPTQDFRFVFYIHPKTNQSTGLSIVTQFSLNCGTQTAHYKQLFSPLIPKEGLFAVTAYPLQEGDISKGKVKKSPELTTAYNLFCPKPFQ